MELRIDPAHPLPVYEQLRSQVARLVASGQLADGARLPTIRQLAADLRLAKGTVERAYALLEADKVIATRGRAGTFVSGPPDGAGITAADLSDLDAAAESLALTARQLGVSDDVALDALRQALRRA